MPEFLLAAAIFGLLATGTVAQAVLTWLQLLASGLVLTAAGLTASLVGGAFYHLALRAALAPRNLLPPGWWWQPTKLHANLRPKQRHGVLVWFGVGASGFVLVLLGCACVLVATFAGKNG